MEPRRDVFQAIADPARRAIIGLLAQEPMNVNALAEKFDVTRQAISLQVKILTECGLIVIKEQGRERFCEAKLDKLGEVAIWIEQYRQSWERKFNSLENYLAKIQKDKKHTKKESNTADREIKISRLFDAPLALVWEVWTQPEHIKNWWGPEGFTSTIHLMDVKKDGEWNLTLYDANGKEFKNKSIYKEIIYHERLVYEHISAPHFVSTVEFEAKDNKTFIKWQMLFDSHEQLVGVIKNFNAEQGLAENTDKLQHYLNTQIHLRKQLKTTRMARVSTYLNFPGTAEAALNFIKQYLAMNLMAPVFSGSAIFRP